MGCFTSFLSRVQIQNFLIPITLFAVTIWDVWLSRRIILETHNRSLSPIGSPLMMKRRQGQKIGDVSKYQLIRGQRLIPERSTLYLSADIRDRDIDALNGLNSIKKVDASINNNTGDDYTNTVLPQKYHIDSMLTHLNIKWMGEYGVMPYIMFTKWLVISSCFGKYYEIELDYNTPRVPVTRLETRPSLIQIMVYYSLSQCSINCYQKYNKFHSRICN